MPGILLSSLLFGLAHGLGSPWLLADTILFGLVTAFLTIRTGGLEAAIALHVVNNLAGFTLAHVTGTMDTTGDPTWASTLISMTAMALYTLMIVHATTPKHHRTLRARLADGIDSLIAAL
ncbi:CPBP family intramembrane glutamic endopeptidase [Actinoplanes couchii]|uniref:CPBP family intramembrane glutamic endopeptidase n=1 Tax=Actinoplanes couchii TaxID=403638 RepID=UPI001943FDBA|nr:CPBP family intramembrane glutamic endopeptidase [Actinoplanes couchii]